MTRCDYLLLLDLSCIQPDDLLLCQQMKFQYPDPRSRPTRKPAKAGCSLYKYTSSLSASPHARHSASLTTHRPLSGSIQPIYHPSSSIQRRAKMSSPPNPFASSPSPPSSPILAHTPARSNQSRSPTPTPPRSVLSAASGSPPPTHRASFPDPSKPPKGEVKLGDRLVGPRAKEGFCCERDREISKGEEISIVDAFKTTEGGKASYITYVIRLGVGLFHRFVHTRLTITWSASCHMLIRSDRLPKHEDDIPPSSACIKP